MNKFLKALLIFFALSWVVTFLTTNAHLTFGHQNFWHHHGHIQGALLLFFLALFPRLTLFLSSIPFGGFFWWVGFFFAPRILVATLATLSYWNQNPFLVVMSWLVALGGESSEKIYIHRRRKGKYFRMEKTVQQNKEDVIEAEFREL